MSASRPVRDLLAALPAIDARSRHRRRLRSRQFHRTVGGGALRALRSAAFDRSPDMIAAARERLPRVRDSTSRMSSHGPMKRDPPTPTPRPAALRPAALRPRLRPYSDVILANAVLHWIPDHARLFPALAAKLAPGGALAVQMPDNLGEPAHRLMREIAAEGPWAAKLAAAAAARPSMPTADRYYEILREARCRVDIWRTTYYHALSRMPLGPVVEWFKGSGLQAVHRVALFGDEEREEFLMRYRSAVARAYPAKSDGGDAPAVSAALHHRSALNSRAATFALGAVCRSRCEAKFPIGGERGAASASAMRPPTGSCRMTLRAELPRAWRRPANSSHRH